MIAPLTSTRTSPKNIGIYLITIVFFIIDITLTVDLDRTLESQPNINPLTITKFGIYSILFLYGIITVLRYQFSDKLLFFFFIYALITAMTMIYSPSHILAIAGGMTLLGVAMSANIIAQWDESELHRLWLGFYIATIVIAFVSLIFFFTWPDKAIAHNVSGSERLAGITGAPNSLGPLMAEGIIIGIYAYYTIVSRRYRWLIIISMPVIFVTLVLTDSRTAILGMLISIVLAHFSRTWIWLWFVTVFVAIIALMYSVLDIDITHFSPIASTISRTGDTSEISTMTGRLEIWQYCITKWLDSPWIGYGLGGPRIIIEEGYSDAWGNTTATAHNFILESLLSVGCIGTALLIGITIAVLVRLSRLVQETIYKNTKHQHLINLLFTCFYFITIDGISEKSYAGLTSPATVLFAAIIGSIIVITQSIIKDQQNENRRNTLGRTDIALRSTRLLYR